MDYEEYRRTYYGYEQDEIPIPEQSGGGGGYYPSYDDVQDMINNALNGITVTQKDEDTTEININGNTTDIDDVYLTGVERDDSDEDNKQVRFKLNNGKDDIVVSVDEFDDPNIDCETF